jgi:signal transduction histidine kinase
MAEEAHHWTLEPSAEELVRAIFEAGPGWNWLVDEGAKVLICNTPGKNGSGLNGRLPFLEGSEFQVDLRELVFSARDEGKPIELSGLEVRCMSNDNKQLTQVRVVPLVLPPGRPKMFWVNLTSYQHPQDLGIQNVENDKLQSMTGLAAKIAHELNNPLDGSMRYINLALRRLQHTDQGPESPQKVTEYLSSAREALGKINGILSDLVRFARNGQAQIETISLNDLVEQAVRTLTARANMGGVSIVTMLSEDLPPAGGTRMYQVFCNLLKNAIDAVEERRKKEPQAPAMVTISTRTEGRTVRINFEDTGIGLPEDRDYLFDPFFTTKLPGEGTGLGLAVSREIVHQYGGKIRAEDGKNGGARFVIELPTLDQGIKREVVNHETC